MTNRIDHRTHDHPNTKAARAACRAGRLPVRDEHPTLELVWRPAPGVEAIVAEIPLEALQNALRHTAA